MAVLKQANSEHSSAFETSIIGLFKNPYLFTQLQTYLLFS